MKTIIYFLLAIFIISILATGFANRTDNSCKILIQSTDRKLSSVLLSQSSEIIAKRLRDFSTEKFDVVSIPEKNQIQVILSKNWDLNITEKLITQKGKLEFYETYNYKYLAVLLKGDTLFKTILPGNVSYDLSAKVGCTSSNKINYVNNYLKSVGVDQKCKLVWDNLFENAEACLYILKLQDGNGAVLKGSDIEQFYIKNGSTNKENSITINFKGSAIKLWADLTKHNINKSIAIVIDNKLIVSPVVRSAIEGGHCEIMGDFSKTEMRYIASVGGSGELPANFEVVK